MWKFVILAASIASGVDVEVTSLDGNVSSGSVKSLTDQEVVIASSDGEKNIPIEELKSLIPKNALITPVKGANQIDLRGGSTILASSFSVVKNRASVTLAGSDDKIELSTRHLDAVRIFDGGEKAIAQWQAIRKAEIAGDAIVLRKSNDQGEIRLDYLEGVLLDIDAEKVTFEYDGEVIPVSRSKVYGIIYYSPRKEELPRAVCQIADRFGSTWNARELKVDDNGISFSSPAGLSQTIRWESVGQVDFSAGNVVYLSEIEFLSFKWTPYISSQFSAELSKLFRPMLNSSFDGKYLKVGGKTFRKGLALRSRTKIEYKLPEEVTKFVALIGVDDRAVRSGAVEITILADGEEIYKATVTGESEPISLSLDISNRRRFAVVVDFSDDADIADQINLCNARFTK
ncbi:MAG: hypothetical protein ACI9G1_001217 [Pirellulaceae bacterium]